MARAFLLVASVVAALVVAGPAAAAGKPALAFDGATPKQQAAVRTALGASAFDWSLIPGTVTVHVRAGGGSYSSPGHVHLDADVLASGRFGWAIVQDEFAHQVDFGRFDATARARLTEALGARDWCYGIAGLAHGDYGCERFASTLVWAYWPSKDNAYRPTSSRDESAAMAPAAFRSLLASVLAVPALASTPRV